MNTVLIILILAMIAGIAFFLAIKEHLHRTYVDYEARSVDQIKSGLADNLLFMDPQKLFVVTIISTIIGGILAYFTFNLVISIAVIILMAMLPKIILKFLKKRRDEKFIYQLPDCLSAIGMSLRAGSNLSRAMELIVEQQPPPISQEFAIVVSDVKMGQQLDDALNKMYTRVEAVEVELFTSAVSISRSVGGNLASTVETLSETIRERLKIEGKIKALTAMGKAQGWVLGCIPLLVIYALYKIEPEAMSAMTTEPIGWAVSAFLLIMAFIAFMIIKKIINIDV